MRKRYASGNRVDEASLNNSWNRPGCFDDEACKHSSDDDNHLHHPSLTERFLDPKVAGVHEQKVANTSQDYASLTKQAEGKG